MEFQLLKRTCFTKLHYSVLALCNYPRYHYISIPISQNSAPFSDFIKMSTAFVHSFRVHYYRTKCPGVASQTASQYLHLLVYIAHIVPNAASNFGQKETAVEYILSLTVLLSLESSVKICTESLMNPS